MAAGEDPLMLAAAPPHVKRELEPSSHEPINLKSEVRFNKQYSVKNHKIMVFHYVQCGMVPTAIESRSTEGRNTVNVITENVYHVNTVVLPFLVNQSMTSLATSLVVSFQKMCANYVLFSKVLLQI